MGRPVVFLSYSHRDEKEKQELVEQLRVLRHDGIELWADDDVRGGEDWERKILERIDKADVAVLLISANFLNSEFICETELPALIRRRDMGGLAMYPVIGKDCAWKSVRWLRSMNVRPKNGEPVWTGNEGATREYLADIAGEIAAMAHSSQPEDLGAAAVSKAAVSDQQLTIYYEPSLHRKHFLDILQNFSEEMQTEAMERVFGRDALHHWRREEETIRERLETEFSLAVIGAFKRGKSTLINAILGREVVTSDISPETVTINEIRYGDELSVEACLVDGGRVRLAPGQLKQDQLSRILKSLPQAASHLDVRAPVEWLRGLCLVDTPGTGDLLRRFDRKVQEYLARADAVVFVLSPLSPLSETERSFLQLAVLPQDFAKIVFVVNMLDKIRDEDDVPRVMEHLRLKIERMFPDAFLFGISALDELARLKREPRLQPERSLSLAARFDSFRAHLQESILDNRDLIQIDRAAADLKRLLHGVANQVEQLRWALETDETRLNEAIQAREDAASPLYSKMKENCDRVRQAVEAMGRQTRDWLEGFLDRLEKMALNLGSFDSEDLQRHFPFFLADTLRTAIHRCLEVHRPLILEEIRQSALPGEHNHLDGLIEGARGASDLPTPAAEATFGDAVWERLEISKALFDLAQTLVFGLALGLMQQLGWPGRNQHKSVLYQQHFLNSLAELRRSLLHQAEQVYAGIAERLAEDVERQQRQNLQMSLDALRQGRQLASGEKGARQRETLDRVPSLIKETQQALLALDRRLWTETMEAANDGDDGLALRSSASS